MTITEAVNNIIKYKDELCNQYSKCAQCPLIENCKYINRKALRELAKRYDEVCEGSKGEK